MKKNSFVEGTVFAYIAILLTKIIGAIYVIPFYNIIGESGGVLYSYAYNTYNLFLNISTSGIPTAVSIIIAEYNALKMYNEREYTFKVANRVISVISFIAFVVMFIFAKQIAYFFTGGITGGNSIESIVLVIRVISFCLLIIPFLSVTRGYLQGNKYVSVSSFSQLIEQVSRVIIVLIGSYVAINVLHYSIPIGVSVALSGTVFGGLCALLFLKWKIHKNKDEFKKGVTSISDSTVTSKEIIKKIIVHAIPVIAIAVTQNIYEMIDLKFIIKGLHMIGYSGEKSELLGSVVVTWGPKICMVINALAIGLCASIIPFIVSSYVKNDKKELNRKFNQAINTIILVGIPLAAFITVFSKEAYYIFYGNSVYGTIVLKALAFVSVLFSLQMVINMMLQGMKKYKVVYLNTIAGIVVNAILDIPMILLLNKIGFYPYLGSLFATAIGQFVSISIVFISMKKEFNFSYKSIINAFFKTMLSTLIMLVVMLILKYFLFNTSKYFITLIELGISGVLSILVYILFAYKIGFINSVLGDEMINKILKKLKIKK